MKKIKRTLLNLTTLCVVTFLALSISYSLFVSSKQNPVVYASNVCPEVNGWSIHQNAPFTEVEGAIEYCFKAGNFLTDTYPAGGFGQAGACNESHIERCGLSHWTYKLGGVTATLTPTPTTTPTDVPSQSPTVSPSPTPTQGVDTSPTLTPTPTSGGDVLATPTATPSATLTLTPTPTGAVEGVSATSVSEVEEIGDVLGISALAATGSAVSKYFLIGFLLIITSLYGLTAKKYKKYL